MGVRDPESVAEHSHRAAILGFLLASLEEGVNPERTAMLCLLHDVPETRIGDLNWVAKRYIRLKEGEQAALEEQAAQLPSPLVEKVLALTGEYEARESREAQLAKDADTLECLLQSREYAIQGYVKGEEWAGMCYDGLRTETARMLARDCLNTDPGSWFEALQSNPYSQKEQK
jgi:putative hydrolases of HD superfamily